MENKFNNFSETEELELLKIAQRIEAASKELRDFKLEAELLADKIGEDRTKTRKKVSTTIYLHRSRRERGESVQALIFIILTEICKMEPHRAAALAGLLDDDFSDPFDFW